MKIIKQEKSKLLPRIDVVAEAIHVDKRTPSREEVKEELSKSLKKDKDLILVEHIYSEYGSGNSKIIAYAYDSKEDMERIIKKGKKQKEAEAKAVEEAKKKAEEDAKAKEEAAKAEEAPVEEAPKEEEKVKENGEEASKE
jgi:ribosomal protein S24E